MGEDVEETGEQRAAHDPGADAVEGVDEAITDHPDGRGAECADENAGRHRNRRRNADDRFASQHDVGDEEADVDQRGEEHDQQRAVAAELATALHHLRDAHLRPLGRGQRNEHAAEHMPQHDGQQAPEQVEVEHLDHHGPGDDRQRRDIGAEPEGEQVASLAVAFGGRHVVDGMVLDQRLLGILGHRLALLIVFVGKPRGPVHSGLGKGDSHPIARHHIMVFQDSDKDFFRVSDARQRPPTAAESFNLII
ncbi:hypothetical protein D3C84_692200 [compost metagenome]